MYIDFRRIGLITIATDRWYLYFFMRRKFWGDWGYEDHGEFSTFSLGPIACVSWDY